ncbi:MULTISPECIES: sodium:proton antiporter NhaD [unclassified Lentimicrobium]|uniref:sodium:proton antiporter NhaD n=1 Tax=unclassified Lentimicrobium TaxID=2677434 RepID=UPI0015582E0D|nr:MULTISPECIES: sodium:proton antiporter NhaD [unclassified Lentimicrobium]NPD46694.1 sodium:proton antiporter NhaD [Lentimicrobium sp. S6]NPD85530.1 sodium:proton antiporter NhaD [Lentimicrobium sp. L6]
MFILMVIIFVLGYAAIALEHPLKIDKAASALLIGVLTWTVYVLNGHSILSLGYSTSWNDLIAGSHGASHDTFHFIKHELEHHLVEIAEILFFLLGAMTIVEVVDRHGGFRIITDKIKTLNKVKLLWIFSILTFFMSAALDNLTTTIVMLALIRKIMAEKEDKWFFASMVVLASNAGGAWSPIGDVTTIMLWIGEQITAQRIIIDTILPSFVTMVVPVIIMSFFMKGEVKAAEAVVDDEDNGESITSGQRNFIFGLGVASLLFVPVFKTVTHLPPYMGMLLGLGNMWLATEIILKHKSAAFKKKYNVIGIIKHVDVATVFFFMGILTAVASLQSAGHLAILAGYLDTNIHNIYGINLAIGVLSAIVDNVPLVAGSMGMYDVFTPEMVQAAADQAYAAEFMQDGNFWKFLAFCAGTGGSILIIGSAAGVAAMGIEKIDFIWYFKKISILAFIGYLSGAFTYWLMFA